MPGSTVTGAKSGSRMAGRTADRLYPADRGTAKRRHVDLHHSRHPPQAAAVPLLASRHARDRSDPRSFAEAHLAGFDDGQLDRYEALLECADADLFDWITGRAAPPPEHDHDVTRLAHLPIPLDALSRSVMTAVSADSRPAWRYRPRVPRQPHAVTLYGAPEGYDAAAIGDVVAEGHVLPGCMSAATTAAWRALPRRSRSSIPSSTC